MEARVQAALAQEREMREELNAERAKREELEGTTKSEREAAAVQVGRDCVVRRVGVSSVAYKLEPLRPHLVVCLVRCPNLGLRKLFYY